MKDERNASTFLNAFTSSFILHPFFFLPFFVFFEVERVLALAAACAALLVRLATLFVALAALFATLLAALVPFLTSFLFSSAPFSTALLRDDRPVFPERERPLGLIAPVRGLTTFPAMLDSVLTALVATSEAWVMTSPTTCEVWPTRACAARAVEEPCESLFCFLAIEYLLRFNLVYRFSSSAQQPLRQVS
jgi:hypothetical protein